MNEDMLNKGVTVSKDKHYGGFVVLYRIEGHIWRAYDWSAFFAHLLLSPGSSISFRDHSGRAVTEFSAYKVMELDIRLEMAEGHTADKMVFIVPANLVISEHIYVRWKGNLPAEPNSDCDELQSTLHK